MSVIPMRTPTTQRVADEVRSLMARYRVSQTELASVLHLSQTVISKRLRGLTPFDANEIGLLADYFNVPISVLFGESQPPDDGGPTRTLLRSYRMASAA